MDYSKLELKKKTNIYIQIKSIFLLFIGLRKYSRVQGRSMQPTLYDGDIVIYKEIFSWMPKPEEGAIVLSWNPVDPKQLIIKRVYRITRFGIELRGDNESDSHDSRKFGTVKKGLIIGEVEAIFKSANK